MKVTSVWPVYITSPQRSSTSPSKSVGQQGSYPLVMKRTPIPITTFPSLTTSSHGLFMVVVTTETIVIKIFQT